MAKVLLIDDHPAVRHGLGLVLSSKAHTICGEAGSIAEAVELLASCPAEIALLDLSPSHPPQAIQPSHPPRPASEAPPGQPSQSARPAPSLATP